MSKFKVGDELVDNQDEKCVVTEVRKDGYIRCDWGNWKGSLYHSPNNFRKIYRLQDLYPDEVACVDEKTGNIEYFTPTGTTGKYTTNEYLAFVKKTLEDMQELIKAKNADYTNGAGPFANFEQASEYGVDPFQGLMLRMGDKMQRVKSYCKQGNLQVKGEGVDDCFKDFIGYSLIALAMLNEKRGKK